MNNTPTLAPTWPAALARWSAVVRRLVALRNRIIAWRSRMRFRWELRQMVKDNPHLIEDIGLTRRQAEAEIAKLPVWQR